MLTEPPDVIRPVNVPLLIRVAEVRTKSSPVSISDFPPEEGRLAVAINPSGSPVLNKNGSAAAGAKLLPSKRSEEKEKLWYSRPTPMHNKARTWKSGNPKIESSKRATVNGVNAPVPFLPA